MSSIDPMLISLGEEYDRLVAAVTAGHVSGDSAMGALAGIHVTDGAGHIWQINESGDYTRSEFMGSPAVVTAPDQFVPTNGASAPAIPFPGAPATDTAAAAAAAPVAVPPAGPSFPAGPSAATPMAVSAPSMPQAGPGQPSPNVVTIAPGPSAAPGAGPGFATGPAVAWADAATSPAPHPAPATSAAGPFGSASAANPFPDAPGHPVALPAEKAEQASTSRWGSKGTGRSLTEAERPARAKSWWTAAKARIAGNGILVVLVLVGLGLFIATQSQSRATPGTTLPSANTQPSGSPAQTGGAEEPDLPQDSGDGVDRPAPSRLPLASIPSRADATAMYSTLSSGRRELVAAASAGKPSAATVSLAAAEWVGVRQMGVTVTPGAAIVQDQVAVQQWVLTQGGATIAKLKVSWVLQDGRWKLEKLPLLPQV